jgi:hypothetical protein
MYVDTLDYRKCTVPCPLGSALVLLCTYVAGSTGCTDPLVTSSHLHESLQPTRRQSLDIPSISALCVYPGLGHAYASKHDSILEKYYRLHIIEQLSVSSKIWPQHLALRTQNLQNLNTIILSPDSFFETLCTLPIESEPRQSSLQKVPIVREKVGGIITNP